MAVAVDQYSRILQELARDPRPDRKGLIQRLKELESRYTQVLCDLGTQVMGAYNVVHGIDSPELRMSASLNITATQDQKTDVSRGVANLGIIELVSRIKGLQFGESLTRVELVSPQDRIKVQQTLGGYFFGDIGLKQDLQDIPLYHAVMLRVNEEGLALETEISDLGREYVDRRVHPVHLRTSVSGTPLDSCDPGRILAYDLLSGQGTTLCLGLAPLYMLQRARSLLDQQSAQAGPRLTDFGAALDELTRGEQ